MKLTTFKPSRMAALLCAGAMGFAVQAHALSIDASSLTSPTWVLGTNYWAVPASTPAPALDADDVEAKTFYSGQLASAYKAEVTPSAEEGLGMDYYSTVFDLAPTDPSTATITQGGSSWIDCSDCFLVVKDGSNDPTAYIFNLGNWNGTETITLTNFWPSNGAISYVEIFTSTTYDGGPPAMIPEADTYAMLLAGLGLVGFAARRKLNKTV